MLLDEENGYLRNGTLRVEIDVKAELPQVFEYV
jgi:hypothetical protein